MGANPGIMVLVWLESRMAMCPSTGDAVVLEGGDDYGVPFLVNELQKRTLAPVVRLGDVPDDAVAIGSVIAEAVNEALGRPLLHHGFPYQVQLRALRRLDAPKVTLVVSGGGKHPRFLRDLAEACNEELGAWLLLPHGFWGIKGRLVSKMDLALSFEEARWMSPAGVSDEDVAELLKVSNGAYTVFISQLYRRPGLPGIVVPFSDRPLSSTWEAEFGDGARFLDDLKRQRRWMDAVAQAVESDPEQVEELLEWAGPEFQARGRLYYLYLKLQRLPEEWLERERTLEWLVVSATSRGFGEAKTHLARVGRFLEEHEAPELRARYATLIPIGEGFQQAVRAATAKPTPLTLWQAGRMNQDLEQAFKYLYASLEMAELEGDWYAVVRAAETLAARYTNIGDFPAGRAWSARGLEVFDQHGLLDGFRRLRLLRSNAASRIAMGDTEGLREELTGLIDLLGEELAWHAHDLRVCLRDLELLDDNPKAAVEQARLFYEAAFGNSTSARTVEYVHALVAAGDVDAAERVALEAESLVRKADGSVDERNQLATAMVRAYRGERDAAEKLRDLLHSDGYIQGVFEYSCLAAVYMLLVNPEGVADVPAPLRDRLAKASPAFLKILSGPGERFAEAVRLVREKDRPRLVIKALGRPSVVLDGELIKPSGRRLEFLLALALHPDGLTNEQLRTFLSSDEKPLAAATVRSTLSQMRSKGFPISEQPVRIEAQYSLDVLEVRSRLSAGDPAGALCLYDGPLVPDSEAPGIIEEGENLEAELRQAILASRDPEVLYLASLRWGDDPELLGLAKELMPEGDPRNASLAGRLEVLEREYELT